MAACPWFLSSFGLMLSPTRNIKTTTPTWLNALRCPRLPARKTYAEKLGAIQPRKEGPSRMPANISPTTRGWLNLENRNPTTWHKTKMMTISSTRIKESGIIVRFCDFHGSWRVAWTVLEAQVGHPSTDQYPVNEVGADVRSSRAVQINAWLFGHPGTLKSVLENGNATLRVWSSSRPEGDCIMLFRE